MNEFIYTYYLLLYKLNNKHLVLYIFYKDIQVKQWLISKFKTNLFHVKKVKFSNFIRKKGKFIEMRNHCLICLKLLLELKWTNYNENATDSNYQ
jgi:hypothetical protein